MSDTNSTICRATLTDAADLRACIAAAYARYIGRITDLPDVSAGVDTDIERNLAWVACQGDRIVGGLILALDHGHAVLKNIAVHPEASGKGLGRLLVGTAEEECARRQLPQMRLTTHADMLKTIAFYKSLGWQTYRIAGNKVHMNKSVAADMRFDT
jgi:ribosomal protein S18 acetylase RimI-like enzyme